MPKAKSCDQLLQLHTDRAIDWSFDPENQYGLFVFDARCRIALQTAQYLSGNPRLQPPAGMPVGSFVMLKQDLLDFLHQVYGPQFQGIDCRYGHRLVLAVSRDGGKVALVEDCFILN